MVNMRKSLRIKKGEDRPPVVKIRVMTMPTNSGRCRFFLRKLWMAKDRVKRAISWGVKFKESEKILYRKASKAGRAIVATV
jgi:hypothetical protein